MNIRPRQRKAYICGPMTNRPFFNFPLFFEVETYLRDQGWITYNPARHDIESIGIDIDRYPTGDIAAITADGFDLGQAMRWDLPRVAESDAIVCLNDWEKSSGGRIEMRVALACGTAPLLYVVDYPDPGKCLLPISEDYARQVVYPHGA